MGVAAAFRTPAHKGPFHRWLVCASCAARGCQWSPVRDCRCSCPGRRRRRSGGHTACLRVTSHKMRSEQPQELWPQPLPTYLWLAQQVCLAHGCFCGGPCTGWFYFVTKYADCRKQLSEAKNRYSVGNGGAHGRLFLLLRAGPGEPLGHAPC